MNATENKILKLMYHIEKTYPRYYLLNESTKIDNIHLYKLIEALEIFRNENETLELINHIEKTYPRYYFLNESTEINNIHLYKIIEALNILIKLF